jgi:hypothetical protein
MSRGGPRRKKPGARALVGVIALRDGFSTNHAFKLAGYKLEPRHPAEQQKFWSERNQSADVRNVRRNGRLVAITGNAQGASEWLDRLGRKLEALSRGVAGGEA